MSDEQAEVKYLRLDGSAECPVAGYDGTIRFPLVMTLAMHKRWQAYVNKTADRDPDDPRIGVTFDAASEENARVVFIYDDVDLALNFGELDVTGPDGKKLKVKSADELPLPVAVWIGKCYREWENSQVTFRWNGAIGLASPNK